MKRSKFLDMKKRQGVHVNPWLAYASVGSTCIYLFWRAFFTLPLHYGFASLIMGILLFLSELLGGFVANLQYWESIHSVEPRLPDIPEDWYPDVDVFIATHNEPVDLLLKTLNGCVHMNYPDKGKVHVWLCDDGNRPEMAELASKFGVGYFGMVGNKHMKAGNLNNALSKTCSPLIVTFDSDMIPTREFLMKTIPYFFLPKLKFVDGTWFERDPEELDKEYKIGFVQTPQSFYNADLFQYNLFAENRFPNEQDYFFRNIIVNRNASNSPIYAGSNTVISRAALEEIGGIATGTITEDFATGIRIQRKGWTTFATGDPLAHGLTPTDFRSLIDQRVRWGRGAIFSMGKEGVMFAKEFSLSAKLGYFCCFTYWYTFLSRLIYILSPILFALFRFRIVDCELWEIAAIWAPSYILYYIMLKKSSSQSRNTHLNSIIDTILCPYLILPLLAEQFGLRMTTFKVTNKSKQMNDKSIVFAIPHIILLATSVLALTLSIHSSLRAGSYGNIVIIFWLVVNCKNLTFAVMFMMGRKNYRFTERFYVSLPVEVDTGRKIIDGLTLDISEEGMAMQLDMPEYLPPNKPFRIAIRYSVYKAEMVVNLIQVGKHGEKWKYCVSISEIDEENRLEYFQIVYDRHHSLPDKIVDNWSMVDDFSINLKKRADPLQQFQRKLPRIATEIPLHVGGGTGVITSFNYQYLVAILPVDVNVDSIASISVGRLKMDVKDSQLPSRDGGVLFRIMNLDEMLDGFEVDEFVNMISSGANHELSATVQLLTEGIHYERYSHRSYQPTA